MPTRRPLAAHLPPPSCVLTSRLRALVRCCLVSNLVWLLASCSFEPTSCAEAACEATSEYCILYGSDTLAPSEAGCHALPAACTSDRSCDCLQRETKDLAFCFEAGECSAPADAALAVVCPGG